MKTPESIFAEAVAAWHMGESNESLKITGDVAIGVELQGDDREDSLQRGGDGKVAHFNGGYLIAGQASENPLSLDGKKEMTLCIRLCDPEGRWDAPLFASCDSKEEQGSKLYCAQVNRDFLNYEAKKRVKEEKSLEFLWRTEPLKKRVAPEYLESDWFKHLHNSRGSDFVDGILRVGVPTELIDQQQWHDVVIRFKDANLELFVDGALVDEAWPHGVLHNFCTPFLIGAAYENGELISGFHGLIDHVALWDKALTDEEIISISGGKAETDKREIEILGEENTALQYWVPRGYNTFVGDCMPFYHNGEFHLYYLYDRRHHTSKWGMGAHQFAHSSSKDLIHWKHHPLSLPITEQWECSLGTGCIFYHEGVYYEFYIHHGKRGYFSDSPYKLETILLATGDDGIHFEKEPEPVVPIDYREFGDVNPDILPTPSGDGFYLSISGWKVFTSTDMRTWEETSELVSPQDIPRWICCSYFEWNGWYYYAGCGMYRMSRDPIGPGWNWTEPDNPATQEGLGVPKIAAFAGNRYLLAGFLPGSYAGEVVFRELVQHEDGTLGTKFPAEMIPPSSKATNVDNVIRISASDGFEYASLAHIPMNARITLQIEANAQDFGLCFRGSEEYPEGCRLRFEPDSQRVQFGYPKDVNNDKGINGVTGLDRPFTLDIIVKNDFIDVCIDSRRTIIKRYPDILEGDKIFFFAQNGEATFSNIQIRPLV